MFLQEPVIAKFVVVFETQNAENINHPLTPSWFPIFLVITVLHAPSSVTFQLSFQANKLIWTVDSSQTQS